MNDATNLIDKYGLNIYTRLIDDQFNGMTGDYRMQVTFHRAVNGTDHYASFIFSFGPEYRQVLTSPAWAADMWGPVDVPGEVHYRSIPRTPTPTECMQKLYEVAQAEPQAHQQPVDPPATAIGRAETAPGYVFQAARGVLGAMQIPMAELDAVFGQFA